MTETPDTQRPASCEDPSGGSGADVVDLTYGDLGYGDLGYDLVRDATSGVRHPGKHRHRPGRVVELPPEDQQDAGDGDYGYDLARDVPRSTQR